MPARVRLSPNEASAARAGKGHEIMEHSESLAEFAAAFAKAQGAFDEAQKGGFVPAFNNTRERRYVSLTDIQNALQKPLADNGLSYMQFPSYNIDPGPHVTVDTLIMHTSGQWVRHSISTMMANNPGEKMAPIQVLGSTILYARRYAIEAIFCVRRDDDDHSPDVGVNKQHNNNNRQQSGYQNGQRQQQQSTAHPTQPQMEQGDDGKGPRAYEAFLERLSSFGFPVSAIDKKIAGAIAIDILGGKPEKWDRDVWLSAANAPESKWLDAVAKCELLPTEWPNE